MKAYRLLLSPSGEPASSLHFLARSDANRYQKILLWPWEELGYFQASSGERIPLDKLSLQVSPVVLHSFYDADLEWIVWEKEGQFGYAPLVPGRCFDPTAWRPVSEQDLKDPILAPKIAFAKREWVELEK